ncbi:MAG: hypothetical protein ACPHUL_00385 [Marinomonas gallaica]
MIKSLLLTAAIVAAPMAHANLTDELCSEIGNVVVKIFDARQSNVPFDEIVPVVRGVMIYSDEDIGMQIAHDAYTSPRWHTEKRRNENRVDLKSKWVLWCYSVEAKGWE